MTNKEAIAIIQKEYKCVDRDCNIERSCGKCDLMMPSKEPILEAYKLAIKALEQQLLRELPPVITMRNATPEERKSINDYIKSISTSTGVLFDNYTQAVATAHRLINNVLGKIITGLEAHKWNKDEGSKAIYDSAINDAIVYVEECMNEIQATELLAEARKCAESEEEYGNI